MESKICMNEACGATTSVEWKKGWNLRSGGFATLCFKCGYTYENLAFCDTYHLEQTGWRKCRICKKRLHCGCIASKHLLELLELGGVGCSSCTRMHQPQPISRNEMANDVDLSSLNKFNTFAEALSQFEHITKASDHSNFHLPRNGDKNSPNTIVKREDNMHSNVESGACFPSLIHQSIVSPKFSTPINSNPIEGVQDMYESLRQTPLSIGLNPPSSETPNFTTSFHTEEMEHNKAPFPFQQGQQSRPILPKPSKIALSVGSDANKGISSQARVARPPAEGRGRNQLLPRYWPKITDQELQQLAGDLNSTVVPLFEKVLSASDAGRIGRLVLPKACAEAYFPSVTHSEGVPIRIQDAKRKEWTFQFRFWPNNNSRMYVLEGVTPCIQSMQLQAGDTVIFSRIDPEGKLVIGSRKASGHADMQDGETSTLPNGEMSFSGVTTKNTYPGNFQSAKQCMDPHLNTLCEQLNLGHDDVSWPKSDKVRGRPNENGERKKGRNILGSKNKRLLMHSDDAMELILTWEEAQDLLRPPPMVKPNIVMIEDHEFEEYDEPPVFGKKPIFTARPSGEHEQWAQCDNCYKWRRLPEDFLLPSKWTCSDNVWDPSRCSCSAPDELSLKEVEALFKLTKDFKRRRTTETRNVVEEHEPCGLDALASAAVLGDTTVSNPGGEGSSSAAAGATTKHPRHRPGCICIVCSQPPSGTGKHKPTCTCNVCMTVKRRFNTLTMRKKRNRQSELEAAEIAQKDQVAPKDMTEMSDSVRNEIARTIIQASSDQVEVGETSNAQIDLNCQPEMNYHGENVQREKTEMSIMGLVEVASLPSENYSKHNGIASLDSCSSSLPQGMKESEECLPAEIEPIVAEHGDEGDKSLL